jgi:predicted nucleic acid-binding protein
VKTPDSIQAASALSLEASAFVTNDRDFLKIPGLTVVLLDEIATPDQAGGVQ